MHALNTVILVGRVGSDPVLRRRPDGQLLCELSIASPQRCRQGDGTIQRTEWVRVRLAGEAAQHCQQGVRQGRWVAIQGRVRVRTRPEASGTLRSEVFVQGDRVDVLGLSAEGPARVQVDRSAERRHPLFDGAPEAADEEPRVRLDERAQAAASAVRDGRRLASA